MALAALTLLFIQRGSLLLPALPNIDLLWLTLPVAIAALWYPSSRILGWIVIALLIQFEQLSVATYPKQLSVHLGQALRVTAEVTSLTSHGQYTNRFTADILQAPTASRLEGHRIQLFYDPTALTNDVVPGSRVNAVIQLTALRGLVNPHSGHSHQRMVFRGVSGRGTLIHYQTLSAQPSLLNALTHRHAIQRWLDDSLSPSSSQVIQAITIGGTTTMDRKQRERLQATGTQHLLVISGLHLSLVGWGIFRFLRWVGLPVTHCYLLAAAAIAGYFWISAQAVSVLRASLMCFLVVGAGLARSRIAFSDIYWFAMIVTLLHSPWVSGLPGFWYSFSCVGVLLLISNTQRIQAQSGWLRFLVSFKTQALLALAVMPLGSILTGFTPLIGPIANQIAIPLMSILVLPPALASVFLFLISEALPANGILSLACGLLRISDLGLQFLWIVLDFFADLGISLTLARLPILYLVIAFAAFLTVITGLRLLPVAAVMAIWLALIAPKPSRPEFATVTLQVIDVGQGSSLLLQTAHHNLLYDAGPLSRSGFDAGAAIVVPALRAKGIDQLHRLIISHGDADHAGGQGSLQRALKIDDVIDPSHADCRTQRAFIIDGVNFQLLSWQAGGNRNNRSCLLQVTGPGFNLVLSGDIEVEAELVLLRQLQGDVDWLMVPHHGSRTSSSPALLNRLRPQWAVVSAGLNNAFHHPHPEIVVRYRNRGARVISTAEQGALTFKADQKGVHWVSSARSAHQRFWSD
jgi:competence protein ComEC